MILAPGFVPFDPSRYETYTTLKHPNVVTSLEFERTSFRFRARPWGIWCGPRTARNPRKIAWLQCVGSRDINRCDHGYCSSVCCMYAIKEAVIAKEHAKEELDCAIFFMDMRTYGKDFESYYDNAPGQARGPLHSIPGPHD